MSKKDDYESGRQDGRSGFASNSSNREYRYGYSVGKQEYDYWNDKNLYPDLRHADDFQARSLTDSEDKKIGLGSVFWVTFWWILILAPFTLFFTWEDWIVQLIFWGGVVVIILVLGLWIYNAVQEEKKGE